MKTIRLIIVTIILSSESLICQNIMTRDSLNTVSSITLESSKSEYNRIYEIKRDLLFAELNSSYSSVSAGRNITFQTRTAIFSLLIAILALFANREIRELKSASKQSPVHHMIVRPWLIILFVWMFMIGVYWTDRYVSDLQKRWDVRMNVINDTLTKLPELNQIDLEKVITFPSLEISNPWRKFTTIFYPDLIQVVSYVPIFFLLAGITINALWKKKE